MTYEYLYGRNSEDQLYKSDQINPTKTTLKINNKLINDVDKTKNLETIFHVSPLTSTNLAISDQVEFFNVYKFVMVNDMTVLEIEISKWQQEIIKVKRDREKVPKNLYGGYHIFVKIDKKEKEMCEYIKTGTLKENNRKKLDPSSVTCEWIENYGKPQMDSVENFLKRIEHLTKSESDDVGIPYKILFSKNQAPVDEKFAKLLLESRRYCTAVQNQPIQPSKLKDQTFTDAFTKLKETIEKRHKNQDSEQKLATEFFNLVKNGWEFLMKREKQIFNFKDCASIVTKMQKKDYSFLKESAYEINEIDPPKTKEDEPSSDKASTNESFEFIDHLICPKCGNKINYPICNPNTQLSNENSDLPQNSNFENMKIGEKSPKQSSSTMENSTPSKKEQRKQDEDQIKPHLEDKSNEDLNEKDRGNQTSEVFSQQRRESTDKFYKNHSNMQTTSSQKPPILPCSLSCHPKQKDNRLDSQEHNEKTSEISPTKFNNSEYIQQNNEEPNNDNMNLNDGIHPYEEKFVSDNNTIHNQQDGNNDPTEKTNITLADSNQVQQESSEEHVNDGNNDGEQSRVQNNTLVKINYKDLEREFNVNDVSPSSIKLAFEIKSGEIDLSSEEMTYKEKSESEFEPSLLPGAYRLTVRGPKEFTVIFLGESGVGKSTLISGLGNYLNWPTFEEAKKNQMQICIPVEFKVQRKLEEGGFDETTVRAGTVEDNENFNDVGQSVTQKPKVHEFTFQSNKIKVIDTPGLSDTRGAEQDKENLRLIRECIHNQKEIHAICIVLKSNDARLRPEFELALRDLLSLFPKPALKNVFFFFTYASGTFFGIGDSTGPVKEMQKKIQDSHEETYSFEGENTCAIDSESFKFLLCKERGVKYSNRPEEDFDFCWNESAAQVKDFLTFIKTVKPIEKKITLAVHHLVTTALNLEEFIRNSDQLTPKKRDNLVKESKIILNVARKWSMVTEYHRLITDLEHWSVDKFPNSCEKCEQLVNSVDKKVSEELFTHVKKAWDLLTLKSAVGNVGLSEEEHENWSSKIEKEHTDKVQVSICMMNKQHSGTDITSADNVINVDGNQMLTNTNNIKHDSALPVAKEDNNVARVISKSTVSSVKSNLSPPESKIQEYTIIFLGESGVSKSTLISGLGNYLNWPTFEEAKKNQMQVCIPLQFKVQKTGEDNKTVNTVITAGDPEDNENFNDIGQSVTQQPKIHEFTFQGNKIKVIDTPGLSEYGNSDLDKEKLNLIRNCVHEQENIHAICIALKSDGSTLNNHCIVTLRWLLSIFPKIALSNVFFFFTHTDRTRLDNEVTLKLLKETQQKLEDIYKGTFKIEQRNIYSVELESFKYILSESQGIKYSNFEGNVFAFSWEETSFQLGEFFKVVKSMKPINKEMIINVHKLTASDSQLRIQGPIKTEDETIISKGMDKLQSMIMKHSLVTPRYSPISEDVKMEELFTDLDEMAPIIEKYRPGVLETILEIKKVIYYFENLQ